MSHEISILFHGSEVLMSIPKSTDTGQLATAAEILLEAAIERAVGCGCSGCTGALPHLRIAATAIDAIGAKEPAPRPARPTVATSGRA